MNSFSQNEIKEYWENGKLKFERKYPRNDSIYVYYSELDVAKLEIIINYDSIAFYSKDGKIIDIVEFINLYGENETNTTQEKNANLKRIRNDSIAEVKEIKRLDKLVKQTKKRKIFFDISKIEIKLFYGEGDVCGNKIDGTKFTGNGMSDYVRSIRAVYLNQLLDIVQYDFMLHNKKDEAVFICKNTGNYISTAMRDLFSKVDSDNFVLSFKNIYLKDKENNYFKINEYKNFKLICDN